MQDPAKREARVRRFCLFETHPGLLFGLIYITLPTKHMCQSRSREHPLIIVKQNPVPPARRWNILFNHAFETIPGLAEFTVEQQPGTDEMFAEKNEGLVVSAPRNL